MYLHLGDDCSVAVSGILAILDIEVYREASKNLLPTKISEGNASPGKKPRSVVITDGGLYFSVISAQSLKKRMESPAYGKKKLHDFAEKA